jgi:hypothetical protein
MVNLYPIHCKDTIKKSIGLLLLINICLLTTCLPFLNFINLDPGINVKNNNGMPNASNSPSYSNFFDYYKIITIDHVKVSGSTSLINFPLLLNLYDSDLRFDVQPDGDDIAFAIDEDWLYHEIEVFNQSYNSTHARLTAWIRIPSLSPFTDLQITMFYGNSTMTAQQNPTSTWAGFEAIWHLKESSGIGAYLLDSTANNYDGTPIGTQYLNNGKIGPARNFTSPTQRISIINGQQIFNGDNVFTFCFWLYPNYASSSELIGQEPSIFEKQTSVGSARIYRNLGGGVNFQVDIRFVNYGTEYASIGINLRQWNYITYTYDGAYLRTYLNGQLQTTTNTGSDSLVSDTSSFVLGSDYNCFKGYMDEFRTYNTGRSGNWILTEYNNQNNPSSFYTVGTEQQVRTRLSNVDYFNFYKIITIDHTKISGTSTFLNFPVLIYLNDTDLRFDVQSDGDDIAFAKDFQWLSHEIELFNQTFNNTHAQLIAWVRIPFLRTNLDTNITMYYGNSSMLSRQNPSKVWDANFKGIWHLNQNPDPTFDPIPIKDSTSPATHGSSSGGMIINDQVEGWIDGSLDFDGINDYVDYGNPPELQITGELTIQAWFKTDFVGGDYLFTKYGGSGQRGWTLRLESGVAPNGYAMFRFSPDGVNVIDTGYEPVNAGQWYHVAGVFKPNEYSKFFLNGMQVDIMTVGIPPSINDPSLPVRIARRSDTDTNYFDGILDELRISNVARSNEWIETEFNNQHSLSSFFSVGTERSNRGIMYAGAEINAIDAYGNPIPYVNISMYNHTTLIDSGMTDITGKVTFSNIVQTDYNFTVTMESDIGNHIAMINSTSIPINIDQSFKIVNLSCDVSSNSFEFIDIDGLPVDSGWIIVGNSTDNLRNCTIDNGFAKFWWLDTIPYLYNYTVYYKDENYNPHTIKLAEGDISTPNSVVQILVELTTVNFTVLTLNDASPVSGAKIKLRVNSTSGLSIVNLTSDINGIATLRWLNSSGINGNYSLQIEFFGENKVFNITNDLGSFSEVINFTVSSMDSLEFRISITGLGDFQTELISLNPNDYIEMEVGSELKLRVLFNVTSAGILTQLLGPSYTDLMEYRVILGTVIVQTGSFNRELDNVGRHFTNVDTSNLATDSIYILKVSGQKSGFTLPSDLIFQLRLFKKTLILNQSQNDDSIQEIYWLEDTNFTVSTFGENSEFFTINHIINKVSNETFRFSIPDVINMWNLSQIVFNVYNISWNEDVSNINITITDPYGLSVTFNTTNHTGWNYLQGEWRGLMLDLDYVSPFNDNSFDFVLSGTFDGPIDVIANAKFGRNLIEVNYTKFNVTDSISILSEDEGWAIKKITFNIINCYNTTTWSLVDPNNDADLRFVTNEGFTYSLDFGNINGQGSLTIDDRTIYPLLNQFFFNIQNSSDIIFDVIISVEYVQEFYKNEDLEILNVTIQANVNAGNFQVNPGDDGDWTEQAAVLWVENINNGINYFLPSELAMNLTIDGRQYTVNDLAIGKGFVQLDGFTKNLNYVVVVSSNINVNFTVSYILDYTRVLSYNVIGDVSYTIIEAPHLHGTVPYNSIQNCYFQLISTSQVDAGEYTVRFSAIKNNYATIAKDFTLVVLNRPTLLNQSTEFFRSFETIYILDNVNFTFSFIDALNGSGINNLDTSSYIWEKYDLNGQVISNGQGSLKFENPGSYSLDFNTQTRSIGEYLLIITLEKKNFQYKNAMILLTIEKRMFNFSLSDNFKAGKINVVKGANIPIQIHINDSTRGYSPLRNATVTVIIDNVQYILEEISDGIYALTFSTDDVDAFFASNTLIGIVNISKDNYVSQQFTITLVVGMEEIFPGIPTFYFILILSMILAFSGSVVVYRSYKKAKIPVFVKKARLMKKSIEKDKKISESLLYREKFAFIAEIVKKRWSKIDVSLEETLGIPPVKERDTHKAKMIIKERHHDNQPLGLILMKWNERIGTEILAKYPEEIEVKEKALMQIYSTHEYSGEKGTVTLMDGASNLVSYYSGPENGFYLILVLKIDDDPDAYEGGITDILQTILQNLEDDAYLKVIPSLFRRLSVYPSLNDEQILANHFQNDIKRMIVNFLREDGVVAKSELIIWLKDRYHAGFVDLDAILSDLVKLGIIQQLSVKGIPSDLIFLTKDVFMLRVPPNQLLEDSIIRALPTQIAKIYPSDINDFFRNYQPTEEDNLRILKLIIEPQVYTTLKLLRQTVVTIKDLEKLKKKDVEDIYTVLKELWESKMIKVYHDSTDNEYYALLTDFYIDFIFPKYMLKVIKTACEQKSKADNVLVEYLKILEETYVNLKKQEKK